jgi:hypothetical protein
MTTPATNGTSGLAAIAASTGLWPPPFAGEAMAAVVAFVAGAVEASISLRIFVSCFSLEISCMCLFGWLVH